ncbi:BTB/POZ domain-containing protein 6-B-like isoform X4 [Zootermopsis nevadensis]|uniref:BTB/POZ domain-containing protein 6-B-like isoform X4 n=1 Tax=Zootermopsis nevadensis TaxID=136037 RepID=UPI000B8EA70E|nr:BTB/POZ domain-containing protein 6-B-like isoform X4 [Zootermopsis nevadensis]
MVQQPKKAAIFNITLGGTKWQQKNNDVKERLSHLRTSGDFSDCVFIVGSGETVETVRAHELIMRMSSPTFEELLITNKSDGAVHITDIEPRIFNMMLDYMYLDHIKLKCTEDASALYKAAVKYNLPYLCEVSAKYMVRDMNVDTLWPILQLLSQVQEPILKEECGKFVSKNPSLVLKHANFPNVDWNIVNMIVELDWLDVPEIEILRAVEKWAEHQCLKVNDLPDRDNKRSAIGPVILSKLRFLAVSREEFVKGAAFSTTSDKGLLTLEESYAILMNLTVPVSYPMPDGISGDGNSRMLAKLRCIRKIQATSSLSLFTPGGFRSPRPTVFDSSFNNTLDQVVALASPSQTTNFGSKNFSLDIKVDHPIVLYGIQVPTLLSATGAKPFANEYDESFVVTVLDVFGTPISRTVFSGKISYGSVIDISLKESIILQKNASYKVQVYTSNVYFLSKKLHSKEDCPPVKFTFTDAITVDTLEPSSPLFRDVGFVTQLIYSVWA